MILVMLVTQAIRPWQEAKLAFFEIVIPIVLCFAGSVTYHTFMANNQNYRRWLFIDVRPQCKPSQSLISGSSWFCCVKRCSATTSAKQ